MFCTINSPKIFPAQVFSSFACFTDFEWNSTIPLPEKIAASVSKRRAEFVASRRCVQIAFESLDRTFTDYLLINDEERVPVWPKGYVGSITHTTGSAAAVIARTKYYRSIGLDSERIMSSYTVEDIKKWIALPDELVRFKSKMNEEHLMTLIFSCKESFYKCLYPVVRKSFHFLELEVMKMNIDKGLFTIELQTKLNDEFIKGTTFNGTFEISREFVHTFIGLPTVGQVI